MRPVNSIYRLIIGIALCSATNFLYADGPNGETGMPDRAELEAAMEACIASLESDGSGRPEPSAMNECMTAKGFSRPSGQRGQGADGMHRPPPSRM
ncbi:MAG: hypothetical protein ABW092_06100 [Candidatus Thiodiazotropha sp.]